MLCIYICIHSNITEYYFLFFNRRLQVLALLNMTLVSAVIQEPQAKGSPTIFHKQLPRSPQFLPPCYTLRGRSWRAIHGKPESGTYSRSSLVIIQFHVNYSQLMCLERRRNGFYHQNLQNMLPMLIYFFRKLKNAIAVISVYKWNKAALWLSILRECFFSTQRNFKTGNLPSSSSGAEKRQLYSSSSSL